MKRRIKIATEQIQVSCVLLRVIDICGKSGGLSVSPALDLSLKISK
jgi:hypothetical protein